MSQATALGARMCQGTFFSSWVRKLLDAGILHLINACPLLGALFLDRFRAVHGEKTDQLIAVNPDFVVSFFLGFVKNELQSEMQVRFNDVVGVFSGAVTGVPEITDHIPGGDEAAFFQIGLVGVVFA